MIKTICLSIYICQIWLVIHRYDPHYWIYYNLSTSASYTFSIYSSNNTNSTKSNIHWLLLKLQKYKINKNILVSTLLSSQENAATVQVVARPFPAMPFLSSTTISLQNIMRSFAKKKTFFLKMSFVFCLIPSHPSKKTLLLLHLVKFFRTWRTFPFTKSFWKRTMIVLIWLPETLNIFLTNQTL